MSVQAEYSAPTIETRNLWPGLWWKLLDTRIGIVPLPIYALLIGIIGVMLNTNGAPGHGAATAGKLSSDILVSIAILAVGGFTCGEIGKRLPILKNLGASAVLATFLPSYLVYAHLIPDPVIASTKEFYKTSNFLYLYIACIIVGSVLGMDRQALIRGAMKIFVPLLSGVVVAAAFGTALGTLLGLGTHHTFFYIIVPMMGGGVGEGVIPISIGYALLTHGDQGTILAEIMPMVMMGSFTCIIMGGVLNWYGNRNPHLTGNGRLTDDGDDLGAATKAADSIVDPATIGAAGVTAVAFYLVGVLAQRTWDFPAPLAMLFLAFGLKAINAISPKLQEGGKVVQKFFATSVTYPLLFSVGVSITPWEKLVGAFTFLNIVVIVSTVMVLITTGFLVAKRLKMHPIDAAVVCSCSAAQGGTGDVAILTSANRLTLLPFCSIATRLGGACMVTFALTMMRVIG